MGVQSRQMWEESGSTAQTDEGRQWEYSPDRCGKIIEWEYSPDRCGKITEWEYSPDR